MTEEFQQKCFAVFLETVAGLVASGEPFYALVGAHNEAGQPGITAAGQLTAKLCLHILRSQAASLEQMAKTVVDVDEQLQQDRHEFLALCRAISGLADEAAKIIGLEAPTNGIQILRERNEP